MEDLVSSMTTSIDSRGCIASKQSCDGCETKSMCLFAYTCEMFPLLKPEHIEG